MGRASGLNLTDADYNVALGHLALSTDTLGSRSTAIGAFSLDAQNFTTATDSHNVAVGYNAMALTTTGVDGNELTISLGTSSMSILFFTFPVNQSII